MGDNRDKWITYRDRLVHEVFVQGSPLMPINSMMTHGLIVTRHGPPGCMPKEPENVKKELRCAVACGTSLQELYLDRDLMNAHGGVLWDELAKGIKWIRRNADVLDDVHWVGGNPWDKESREGSFDDQRPLDGFTGKTVDIDKELTFTLKPFEVFVYEGGKVK